METEVATNTCKIIKGKKLNIGGSMSLFCKFLSNKKFAPKVGLFDLENGLAR